MLALTNRCFLSTVAMVSLGVAVSSSAAAEDKSFAEDMRETIPWAGLVMPGSLYDYEALAERWARIEDDDELRAEAEQARRRAAPYLAIPESAWEELIPNRSPLPVATTDWKIHCPFSGASVRSGVWHDLDIVRTPFRLRARFSDAWLHEREEDRPEDDPLEIAGHEKIRYWDGRVEDLAYVHPSGRTEGPRYYPANIVWEARLQTIVQQVLPALRGAYLATGDNVYARHVRAILERFADIYPSFPQGTNQAMSDRTREVFLAEPRREVYLNRRLWQYPSRLLVHYGIIGDSQVAREMALGYLAIRESAIWGEGDERSAIEEHLRKNLFEEFALTFTAVDKRCGNHIGGYITTLLALGIVLQDEFLVGRYNQEMMEFLYSHHFYDGISREGSVLYSYMLNSMVRKWHDEFAPLYPGLADRHPFVHAIGRTAPRMSTLLGRESAHNDGFDGVFGTRFTLRDGLDTEGNELREPSEAFPGFGTAILRAGGPGRRLEAILSFDRAVGHDHDDPLGLQIFYRGVPIVNHLGYTTHTRHIDLNAERNPLAEAILAIPFPAPLRVFPERGSPDFPEYRPFGASTITKNTVLVDEYTHRPYTGHYRDGAEPYGNLDFIRLSPEADGTEAGFEVVEASMANMLRGAPTRLDDFRRAIVAVTRPDGRPYLLDVIWVTGGSRHMMLLHSHGEETESTFPEGETVHGTLTDWLDAWVPQRQDPTRFPWYRPTQGEEFIRQVGEIPSSAMPRAWHHTWRLDWLAWAGGWYGGAPAWAEERITPVSLRIHGWAPETFESEVLGFRALSDYFATFTNARIGGQRLSGGVAYEDAMHYIGQVHRGSGAGALSSTFAHVIEPFADGEESWIRSVEQLTPELNPYPFIKGAVGLRIAFEDGTTDLLVALPEERRLGFENGPLIEGRFALVRLDAGGGLLDARLVGGTLLAYGGETRVEAHTASFDGALLRMEGDVSGDRSRSALIIQPTTPWPADGTLNGRNILVRYRSGRTEGYRVDRIEAMERARIRVLLEGNPPFVDEWGRGLRYSRRNRLPWSEQEPECRYSLLERIARGLPRAWSRPSTRAPRLAGLGDHKTSYRRGCGPGPTRSIGRHRLRDRAGYTECQGKHQRRQPVDTGPARWRLTRAPDLPPPPPGNARLQPGHDLAIRARARPCRAP